MKTEDKVDEKKDEDNDKKEKNDEKQEKKEGEHIETDNSQKEAKADQ